MFYRLWHEEQARCSEIGNHDADAFAEHGGAGGARRHEADRSVQRVQRESSSNEQVDGAGSSRWAAGAEAKGARGGRAKAACSRRIRQLTIDSLPGYLKLPFYLWTRAAVVRLIEREYGISVSLSTVGRYLAGWGMNPQKPAPRTDERNGSAIAR